jgi:hypothetical protein
MIINKEWNIKNDVPQNGYKKLAIDLYRDSRYVGSPWFYYVNIYFPKLGIKVLRHSEHYDWKRTA